MIPNNIAVIGGGPAGLMAAEVIAQAGHRVTLYDAMPSVGRKFLMAGRGGLNLTHSEALSQFLARYGAAEAMLAPSIAAFTPDALRAWSDALGEATFIGSSGRVFPNSFKASPLLRAWLRRLAADGVTFATRHRWRGWSEDGRLQFETSQGSREIAADATVLALGGASWPRLGSDGAWTDILSARGVAITPLQPSNSGFNVAWSDIFRDRFAGQPLKNIALSFGAQRMRGEALVTRDGLEGGAIYALSSMLRDAIAAQGKVTLHIALKPDTPVQQIEAKLAAPRGKQSLATFLRKALGLSPVEIALLQEAAIAQGMRLADMPPATLADFVQALPITLTGIAPIDRAISSAGGIALAELDDNLMLRRLPGMFAAGEMLDWEAPTGGYLLQACFATGAAAGQGVLRWLQDDS